MGSCALWCQRGLLALCAVLTVTGVAMLAGLWDVIFDSVLHSKLEVVPGSISYDIWRVTPMPIVLSFHLYNLTNPKEFEKGKELPNVEEVGPYVYNEYHEKVNITFHPNDTISFFTRKWWVFDPVASGNRSEEDPICFLNTIPISAAYTVRKKKALLEGLGLTMTLLGEEITLTKPVGEVLFEGYEDPLLNMTSLLSDVTDNLPLPPGLTDYDKMGWFYLRNMSDYYDGFFNMFSGHDTLDVLGDLDWWNKTQNPGFFTDQCGQIEGSAGELWPPNQSKTNITFYSTDLCMSLTLQYKEEVTDSNGIDGFRYWADAETFTYPTDNRTTPRRLSNQCYCYENDIKQCPPDGLLDAQTCRLGSPAFISFPRFFQGDPSLFEDVTGLEDPVEENHMFYIDMIPELGTPLSVRARMQINMAVTGYKEIRKMKKLPTMILPLLWFEASAELPADLAEQIKPVLYLLRSSTIAIVWGSLTGVSVIVGVVVMVCYCKG